MKPGLPRIADLLESVGRPQDAFRVVQVGGTNGKGSTCSMIASVLREHGIKTGLYTSPHVVDYTERMTIDGVRIDRGRVCDLMDRMKPEAERIEATFFELSTAAAALYFAEENVDVAVAEVGLGGRLDATSALDSMLSVITGIAVDHANVLGSEPRAIASEKAGIIREGGVVVCGATGDAADVIRGAAAARRARYVGVSEVAAVGDVSVGPAGSTFDFEYKHNSYDRVSVSMLGRHQVTNAASALVSLCELERLGLMRLSAPELRRGLSRAHFIGRMQILSRRPTVIADVAHNPDAAAALMSALSDVIDYDRLVAVLGIMADKDVHGFLFALAGRADSVVLTRPATERAADPAELSSVASELGLSSVVVPSVEDAFSRALSEAQEGDLVLVTGSHYTVGEVMAKLEVNHALGS
jgi:dihydrofolate synthase/folylpolyglutamate synthase